MALGLAIPLAGFVGLILGCTLGAWMGSASVWKAAVAAIGGGFGQAVIAEFIIKPLTMIDNVLLDYAIFFVVAGGIAQLLGISAKATALIVIGAFVGMMTFAIAAFELVLSVAGS